MNLNQTSKKDEIMIVKRGKFLTLLQSALAKKEFQFARRASLIWLANYPGDLLINFIYASVLAELGDTDMAITVLEKITAFDPEFTEAIKLLTQLTHGEAFDVDYHSVLAYLQHIPAPVPPTAKWLTPLMNARYALENGDVTGAEKAVLASLAQNPKLPLPAILHMQIVNQTRNYVLLDTLAGIYASRWPDCIQIKLLSAVADMQKGDDSKGVEKLHWSAAHDVGAQVVTRSFGPDHSFKPIWPEELKVYLDLAIPAPVAAELGWNVLAGAPATAMEPQKIPLENQETRKLVDLTDHAKLAKHLPDYLSEDAFEYTEVPPASFLEANTPISPELKSVAEHNATVDSLGTIQAEFDKLAKNLSKKELLSADSRFPNYVLLTSKTALANKYGANTANVIIDAMQALSHKITALPNWNSLVFVPDDAEHMSALGMTPIQANDAWKMKLALADLDKNLGARGEMIGVLLIIGGNDIVPFHQLPNPTDDADVYVASDNPYATTDENYFIQQWPVGRIPDEAGNDAVFLLEQLHYLNNEYRLKVKAKTSLSGTVFESWFLTISDYISEAMAAFKKSDNIGCSAEVWKIPSAEVFSVIDRADRIRLSPPLDQSNFLSAQRSNPQFAYFNLHGLKDGPEWYGQRNLQSNASEMEYPVALVPALFNKENPAPEFVMSEACYGAYIIDKKCADSMAMNFLATGSRGFVGSTCIAYGSVARPLIAADLFARDFWTYIQAGVSAGYAVMRAKLHLAQLMTQSQGYLDGEDQKTILSFVLYGDPLASKDKLKHISKPLLRPSKKPDINTISDSREELIVSPEEMPTEILDKVKKVISAYLPDLNNANMTINPQLTNFSLDPQSVSKRKERNPELIGSERYVVTLKKSFEAELVSHTQYARVTFDQKGEMLKLSTSR